MPTNEEMARAVMPLHWSGWKDQPLNRRIAFFAGLCYCGGFSYHPNPSCRTNSISVRLRERNDPVGGIEPPRDIDFQYVRWVGDEAPDFAKDLNACREFEVEIKRRGLVSKYITHLFLEALSVALPLPRNDEDEQAIAIRWVFAHATAAQKLAAAYAVIQGLEPAPPVDRAAGDQTK